MTDQQTVKLLTYTGNHRTFNSGAHDFCRWCGQSGATKHCRGQIGNAMILHNWPRWQAIMRGRTKMCWRMHSRRNLLTSRREKCMVQFGTQSRCNNPHADETWMCGQWRQMRQRKTWENFARETSECEDANSCVFGGWIAVQVIWKKGQLLHQKTVAAQKANKTREKV